MSATLHDGPPEPTGFVVVIPNKEATHGMCVGPFETRQAALDFSDDFLLRVEIEGDGLLIGAMYAPAFIMAVVLDTQERKASENG